MCHRCFRGHLYLRRNINLIIEHPAVVLAVPDPSVKRLKCSWHLGMMMRIIETLLLKTQACTKFSVRNASHPHTPRLFAPESETSQPEIGHTHIAVHHRMTRHEVGTLTAPSPFAHALTSRSP